MAKPSNAPGPPRKGTWPVIDLTSEVETSRNAPRSSKRAASAHPSQPSKRRNPKQKPVTKVIDIASTDDDESVAFQGARTRDTRMSVAPETFGSAAKRRSTDARNSRAVTAAPTTSSAPGSMQKNPREERDTGLSPASNLPRLDPQQQRDGRSQSVHPAYNATASKETEAGGARSTSRAASAFNQRTVSPETEEIGLEGRLNRMRDQLAQADFSLRGNGPALITQMFDYSSRLTELRQISNVRAETAMVQEKGGKRRAESRNRAEGELVLHVEKRARVQRDQNRSVKDAQPGPNEGRRGHEVSTETVAASAAARQATKPTLTAGFQGPKADNEVRAATAPQKQANGAADDKKHLTASQRKRRSAKRRKRERQELASLQESFLQPQKQERLSHKPLSIRQEPASSPCVQAASVKEQKGKQVVKAGGNKDAKVSLAARVKEEFATGEKKGETDQATDKPAEPELTGQQSRFKGYDRPISEALRTPPKATKDATSNEELTSSDGSGLSPYDRFYLNTFLPQQEAAAQHERSFEYKQRAFLPVKANTQQARQPPSRQAEQQAPTAAGPVIDLCMTTESGSSESSSSESSNEEDDVDIVQPKTTAGLTNDTSGKGSTAWSTERNGKQVSNTTANRCNTTKSGANENARAAETESRATSEAPFRAKVLKRNDAKPTKEMDQALHASNENISGAYAKRAKRPEQAQVSTQASAAPRSANPQTIPAEPNQSDDVRGVTKASNVEKMIKQREKKATSRKRIASQAPDHDDDSLEADNVLQQGTVRDQSEYPSKKPKKQARRNTDVPCSQPEPRDSSGRQISHYAAAGGRFDKIFKLTENPKETDKPEKPKQPTKTEKAKKTAHRTPSVLPTLGNVPDFEYARTSDGRLYPRMRIAKLAPNQPAPSTAASVPTKKQRHPEKENIRPGQSSEPQLSETREDPTSSDSSEESSSESESSEDGSSKQQVKSSAGHSQTRQWPTVDRNAPGRQRLPIRPSQSTVASQSTKEPSSAARQKAPKDTQKPSESSSTSDETSSSEEDESSTSGKSVKDATTKKPATPPNKSTAPHVSSQESHGKNSAVQQKIRESSLVPAYEDELNEDKWLGTQDELKRVQQALRDSARTPDKAPASQKLGSSGGSKSSAKKDAARKDSARKAFVKRNAAQGDRIEDGLAETRPALSSPRLDAKELPTTQDILNHRVPFTPLSPEKSTPFAKPSITPKQVEGANHFSLVGSLSSRSKPCSGQAPKAVHRNLASGNTPARSSYGEAYRDIHRPLSRKSSDIASVKTESPSAKRAVSNHRAADSKPSSTPRTPRSSGNLRSSLKNGGSTQVKTTSPLFSKDENAAFEDAEGFLGDSFSMSDELRKLQSSPTGRPRGYFTPEVGSKR